MSKEGCPNIRKEADPPIDAILLSTVAGARIAAQQVMRQFNYNPLKTKAEDLARKEMGIALIDKDFWHVYEVIYTSKDRIRRYRIDENEPWNMDTSQAVIKKPKRGGGEWESFVFVPLHATGPYHFLAAQGIYDTLYLQGFASKKKLAENVIALGIDRFDKVDQRMRARNAFAAELIMPKEAFLAAVQEHCKGMITTTKQLELISKICNDVSVRWIKYRAEGLGVLSLTPMPKENI